MTRQEDWITEPPRRGWLSRLLAPEANARPATTSFVVATLGAAAFVASLTMQWQSASVPVNFTNGEAAPRTLTYANTVTSPEMLGLVYALGVTALLSLAGAVINRSDLALRMRLAAAGLTVAMLAVVLAITMSLPSSLYNQFGQFGIPTTAGLTVSYEPGLLCAYVAVVLPIVAIWLAARPALRDVNARDMQARGAGRTASARHAVSRSDEPAAGRRPEESDGRQPEPLDLTVTPER